MVYFYWWFFALFIIVVFSILYTKVRPLFIFKRTNNPYRRVCRSCGSVHGLTVFQFAEGESRPWWEIEKQGNYPGCHCKKYATYKSPHGFYIRF